MTREDQGGLGRPRNVSLGRSLEWRPFPWHSQARRENKVVSPDKEESDSDHLSREEGGGRRSPRSFPSLTSTSETRFGVSAFPSPCYCRRKFGKSVEPLTPSLESSLPSRSPSNVQPWYKTARALWKKCFGGWLGANVCSPASKLE